MSNTRRQLVPFLLDVGIIYVADNKRCNASLRDPLALVVKRDRIIVFPVVKTPIRCGRSLCGHFGHTVSRGGSTCDSLATTFARINFMNCLYDRINVL